MTKIQLYKKKKKNTTLVLRGNCRNLHWCKNVPAINSTWITTVYRLINMIKLAGALSYNCYNRCGVLTQFSLHTSAREPCVWICVNKQLHLEQVSDVLRVEHEDALKQDHISGIHRNKLLFPGRTHMEEFSPLCQ